MKTERIMSASSLMKAHERDSDVDVDQTCEGMIHP
jgi:hypothetical protein